MKKLLITIYMLKRFLRRTCWTKLDGSVLTEAISQLNRRCVGPLWMQVSATGNQTTKSLVSLHIRKLLILYRERNSPLKSNWHENYQTKNEQKDSWRVCTKYLSLDLLLRSRHQQQRSSTSLADPQ